MDREDTEIKREILKISEIIRQLTKTTNDLHRRFEQFKTGIYSFRKEITIFEESRRGFTRSRRILQKFKSRNFVVGKSEENIKQLGDFVNDYRHITERLSYLKREFEEISVKFREAQQLFRDIDDIINSFDNNRDIEFNKINKDRSERER